TASSAGHDGGALVCARHGAGLRSESSWSRPGVSLPGERTPHTSRMWPDDTTWSFTGGFSQEAEGFTARAQHEATGTRRPRRWARRAQRIPPESTPPQSSRHHKQDPQRTRSGSRSDVVTRNHGRALEVKTVDRIFSPSPKPSPTATSPDCAHSRTVRYHENFFDRPTGTEHISTHIATRLTVRVVSTAPKGPAPKNEVDVTLLAPLEVVRRFRLRPSTPIPDISRRTVAKDWTFAETVRTKHVRSGRIHGGTGNPRAASRTAYGNDG